MFTWRAFGTLTWSLPLYLIYFQQNPENLGIPIFQMRTLKLKEVKALGQGHTANKCQS